MISLHAATDKQMSPGVRASPRVSVCHFIGVYWARFSPELDAQFPRNPDEWRGTFRGRRGEARGERRPVSSTWFEAARFDLIGSHNTRQPVETHLKVRTHSPIQSGHTRTGPRRLTATQHPPLLPVPAR